MDGRQIRSRTVVALLSCVRTLLSPGSTSPFQRTFCPWLPFAPLTRETEAIRRGHDTVLGKQTRRIDRSRTLKIPAEAQRPPRARGGVSLMVRCKPVRVWLVALLAAAANAATVAESGAGSAEDLGRMLSNWVVNPGFEKVWWSESLKADQFDGWQNMMLDWQHASQPYVAHSGRHSLRLLHEYQKDTWMGIMQHIYMNTPEPVLLRLSFWYACGSKSSSAGVHLRVTYADRKSFAGSVLLPAGDSGWKKYSLTVPAYSEPVKHVSISHTSRDKDLAVGYLDDIYLTAEPVAVPDPDMVMLMNCEKSLADNGHPLLPGQAVKCVMGNGYRVTYNVGGPPTGIDAEEEDEPSAHGSSGDGADPNGRRKEGCTFVTQTTIDRLKNIHNISKVWDGPISVAVYVGGSEELVARAQRYIPRLQALFPSVRKWVSFHIVQALKAESDFELYPINLLRNIAWEQSRTNHIMSADIDLLPPRNAHFLVLSQILRMQATAAASGVQISKTLMVLPAFEVLDEYAATYSAATSTDSGEGSDDTSSGSGSAEKPKQDIKVTGYPVDKEALKKLVVAGAAQQVHKKKYEQAHQNTNYEKWLDATDPYPVEYSGSYEPYFVGPADMSPYDDQFVGYGHDKVSQLHRLQLEGYKLYVCPDVFLVHINHPPPVWRSNMDSFHIMNTVQMGWYHYIYSVEKELGKGQFWTRDKIERDVASPVSEEEFEEGLGAKLPDFTKITKDPAVVSNMVKVFRSLRSNRDRGAFLKSLAMSTDTTADLLHIDSALYKFMPGSDTKGQSPFTLPASHVEASELEAPAALEVQAHGKEASAVDPVPEPTAAKSEGLLSSKRNIEPEPVVAQPATIQAPTVQPSTVDQRLTSAGLELATAQHVAVQPAAVQPDAASSSMSSVLHFTVFAIIATGVVLFALKILRHAKGRKSS